MSFFRSEWIGGQAGLAMPLVLALKTPGYGPREVRQLKRLTGSMCHNGHRLSTPLHRGYFECAIQPFMGTDRLASC
jgi:hypothetical protein